MTSAGIFKDTFGNDTQVVLNFKNSVFEIRFNAINFNFNPYLLTSSTLTGNVGTSREIPPDGKWSIITRDTNHILK